jgi:hypothetical protein
VFQSRLFVGRWAVELVSDGSLMKHQEYFVKGGQHEQYSANSAVVVSFSSDAATLDSLKVTPGGVPVVAVAPHRTRGWSYFEVKVFEGTTATKLTVPRFGVPVDRNAKACTVYSPVAEANANYYVKVALPNVTEPVTTDVGATLRKEGLSMTVDGLKDAVKKELEDNGYKANVFTMKVYPPGKARGAKAYAKMSTPLEGASEEQPYHVEVA